MLRALMVTQTTGKKKRDNVIARDANPKNKSNSNGNDQEQYNGK